jgi:hypothetical protein
VKLLGIDQDTVPLTLERHEMCALFNIVSRLDEEVIKEIAVHVWGEDPRWQDGTGVTWADYFTHEFQEAVAKIQDTWYEAANRHREIRYFGPALLGIPPGKWENEKADGPGGGGT